MPLNEIYLRLTRIGEQADALCRHLPRHRFEMGLRDFHTQISLGMLQMSEATREPNQGRINEHPKHLRRIGEITGIPDCRQ